MNIENKFWKPSYQLKADNSLASFSLETYRGYYCNYSYNADRDMMLLRRKTTEYKKPQYLVANRPGLLKHWINRTINKKTNYFESEEVAFREMMPLKIGLFYEPFPLLIEEEELITYSTLKILHEYDYPVEIYTMNPDVLSSYAEEFKGANWKINVIVSNISDDLMNVLEVPYPQSKKAFDSSKNLVKMGFEVSIRVQPIIYPLIAKTLPKLIGNINGTGCASFSFRGFNFRVFESKGGQALIEDIESIFGVEMKDFYTIKNHSGETSFVDYELMTEKNAEFIFLIGEFVDKNPYPYKLTVK